MENTTGVVHGHVNAGALLYADRAIFTQVKGGAKSMRSGVHAVPYPLSRPLDSTTEAMQE
jgi:hypothetical protein